MKATERWPSFIYTPPTSIAFSITSKSFCVEMFPKRTRSDVAMKWTEMEGEGLHFPAL
jgi:hypothetical protein